MTCLCLGVGYSKSQTRKKKKHFEGNVMYFSFIMYCIRFGVMCLVLFCKLAAFITQHDSTVSNLEKVLSDNRDKEL